MFPAVVKALRPEDWADIALQLADRYGPPSQPDFKEQFSTRRRNILEMEHEAQAERPDWATATAVGKTDRQSLAFAQKWPARHPNAPT